MIAFTASCQRFVPGLLGPGLPGDSDSVLQCIVQRVQLYSFTIKTHHPAWRGEMPVFFPREDAILALLVPSG